MLLQLTEVTSFLPPLTQTRIEGVFSNGVKKKKMQPFPQLAFKILYMVHVSAIPVWGAGSEVFALREEIRVRVGAEDVLIPEHIIFCSSVSLQFLH